MNLPAGLIFYLDFQYGTGTANKTVGESLYGASSDLKRTSESFDTGLYGAGEFGYSMNTTSSNFTAKAANQIGVERLQSMMEDAEMQADAAGRQNMQVGGEAEEEEKDMYGRPIMESDKDEEIKKAMLSVNPRTMG